VAKFWVELNLGQWFDPGFRAFIDEEMMATRRGTG